MQSLCLVLAIAGRPEWILPLWIAIIAMILSLAGVVRRNANRERVVAPIRSTGEAPRLPAMRKDPASAKEVQSVPNSFFVRATPRFWRRWP